MASNSRLKPLEADEYLQQFAKWLRSKERRLASASPQAILRRKTSQTWLASLATLGGSADPLLLKLSLHHLDVLLIKFEEYGMDRCSFGPIDVPLDFQPSRPSTTVFLDDRNPIQAETKSKKGFDTMSMLSWMSSVSSTAAPTPATLSRDARYCFSAFTKIPSLQLSSRDSHFGLVKTFESTSDASFVPLDLFKNLQLLRLVDIDARVIFGWDKLCQSLRVLDITGSDLDDLQHLLIERLSIDARTRSREFRSNSEQGEDTPYTRPDREAWPHLRRLSLPGNALTYAPGEEFWNHFSNVVHLDLSNNLLLSVPDGLSSLVALRSLNLSNNMIQSLSGISRKMGAIQSLDLSRNRIQSLAGLEQLKALQSIDVSHNSIDEAAEVARLAPLPQLLLLVAGEGNMLANLHARLPWRIELFVAFAREDNQSILIDGTRPTWLESRSIAAELLKNPAVRKRSMPLPVERPSPAPLSAASLEQTDTTTQAQTTASEEEDSSTSKLAQPTSPPPVPTLSPMKAKQKRRRKPAGRIVNLDSHSETSQTGLNRGDQTSTHRKTTSDGQQFSRDTQPVDHPHYQSMESTLGPGGQEDTTRAAGSSNDESDNYRKRIENLRSEVGEDWLRVLSQQDQTGR